MHDGLQVAEGDGREEKYPAVLIDAPKTPITADVSRLCLTSIENTQRQSGTTCALPGDLRHARLGTR